MNTTATFSSVLHLQHNPWATPLFVSGPSSHELDTVALWNTSPEDLVRVVALRLASEVWYVLYAFCAMVLVALCDAAWSMVGRVNLQTACTVSGLCDLLVVPAAALLVFLLLRKGFRTPAKKCVVLRRASPK
eukprot:TRINITY_DN4426_c0_g1_i1.p2 TRINITY_DN4426_c0_g1~~TRINITY_DN4426_c0_g1_i1.p2  ORF type:complete len:132 (+),score=36.54 TRINITY_DN4426_c0_g1_i1:121-516(+)